MSEADYVTVYRSADDDAETDVSKVQDYLTANGLHPVIVNDKALGVVPGAFEVRVPTHEAAEAEQVLSSFDPDALPDVDPSSDLDAVTVFSGMGATAEVEALAVQSVLEANDIPCFLIGDSALPNLEFQVKVPRLQEVQARQALAEAQAAGPAAAERGSEESSIADPRV